MKICLKTMSRAAIALGALLAASILPGTVCAGTLLKENGVSTSADADRYYATIDPLNQRLTQAAWREVNGFNSSLNQVVTTQGHKNESDLGFWRRIDMVVDNRVGFVGNVAMTTFNFEAGKCCNEADAKSIVNMEYSPGPGGEKITKFYIYDATTGARKNSTIFDPNLARAEELNLPNACAACHGGGHDFTGTGKTGGGWLAFDFNVFSYDGTTRNKDGSTADQASNEANVKKLNQGILKTNPDDAVRGLISLVYGGSRLPRATQNTAYMRNGWSTEPALWKVLVTDCQECHTNSQEDVLYLDSWQRHARSYRDVIFYEHVMPNSPYANDRFWSTDHYQIVDDALRRFGAP